MSSSESPVAAESVADSPPQKHAAAYWQLIVSVLFSAAAQLFLKLGAGTEETSNWLGTGGLHSGWVWLGMLSMILSLFSWLYALRFIPLSLAFTLAGGIHVLVPLASWLWLGESISPRRWFGILLVVIGVFISAKPATQVEEKL